MALSLNMNRTNQSLLGRWWWTVDRPTLLAVAALIAIGAVLVTAASPPVAVRIGLDPFYFIGRQHLFLFLAAMTLFAVSLLNPTQVRRLAIVIFGASILLMCLLPFLGTEVKGAHRWLSLAGVSIQPSEFLKPCFAVVMAWVFAERHRTVDFPSWRLAVGLYLIVAFLLIIQPDLGMTLTVTGMWAVQFFLAGLPFPFILVLAALGVGGLWLAYMFLPHVTKRIDMFLDPSSGDNYQIAKSLEAFRNGGFLGRGPGEGEVKLTIPDSHTDFIFAVAGEEFGALLCLLIIALFGFIVLRGLTRVWRETDLFVLLAVSGLIVQFGFQAMVNMGVAVNMLPAKGMTLPFLSYGGSSLLAMGLGIGMMLALTRRKFGEARR